MRSRPNEVRFVVRGGPAWLYLALPDARDADAALTIFRTAKVIDATDEDLEGLHRMLYIAPWVRLIADHPRCACSRSSLFFPDWFDGACRMNQFWPAVAPNGLLDDLFPNGAALRAQRRDLLAGWLEAVANHGTTEENWDGMSRAERIAFTDPLRAFVVTKESEIVGEIVGTLRQASVP